MNDQDKINALIEILNAAPHDEFCSIYLCSICTDPNFKPHNHKEVRDLPCDCWKMDAAKLMDEIVIRSL